MAPHRSVPARIPAFHAVPVRIRKDGWTPLRQAEFIGHLAETGHVGTAAARVGMKRETAYRLRRRDGAESFVAAWDAALSRGRGWAVPFPGDNTAALRKVTLPVLQWRVETGLWCVRLRRGRYVGVARKFDNFSLLTLMARVNRAELSDWLC